jgi:hypothetical protein
MNVKEFAAMLENKNCHPIGSGTISARCPAHDDGRASLSVTEGAGGKILVHCHASCEPGAIVGALGLKLSDLFPDKPVRNGSAKHIVATYHYRDESGALLFEVVRFEPKDFRQRRPDPTTNEGWTWKVAGTRRVLFRLPELIDAVKAGETIFVCEGEKDALALVANGFEATCNSGGAGKWRAEYSKSLEGARIVVVADKDEPGRKHAQEVADSLHGVAANVRVLELPDTNGKPVKDGADFFTAGGTADQLRALVDAAPEWASREATSERADVLLSSSQDDFAVITAGLRGEIIKILSDTKTSAPEQRRRIACVAVDSLCRIGRLYFHSERRDFDSAMYFNSETKRLERIRGDAFAAWLSDWLKINRADQLFRHVIAAVETAALAGGTATGILPESFWAARPGAIYLSCGDGRIVKLSAAGITFADNGADGVLFPSGCTLLQWQLTTPLDVFDSCRLFRDVHCSASHGKDLLRLWLYSLPSNPANKPPLCMPGLIGSGKTRTAKGFAEFYGMPHIENKVEEAGEADFWPSCDAGGILTLDNADTRCRWLKDTLSSASTGGCSRRRRLYTNNETVILRARAWICITTANPLFASDSGLADRLCVVRMDRRDGEETSDAELSAEIAANRDAGLSHLAHTLHKALADIAPTPPGLNERHPDFASFAVRIGRALGREAEAVAALRAAEMDKSAFCLENDTIATALLRHLSDAGSFSGTASELMPHLIKLDPDLDGNLSAKRLGKRLNALWPHIGAVCKARKQTDRKGFTIFSFAEFAEFQTVISQNLFHVTSQGDFLENVKTNSANSALEPDEVLNVD